MPDEPDKIEARALVFQEMAERIRHNRDNPFGGAAVIVPPDGSGEPVAFLFLDKDQDPLQFWKTTLEKAKDTVERVEREKNASAFGVRRG